MKKLESTETTATDGDSVSTVPVVAEDSAFADSCEYVVQLETEFPEESPSIDEGVPTDAPVDPDLPVRRAA